MSNVASIGATPSSIKPLFAVLDLSHRARQAATLDELAFLLVNDTRALLPYRQAALWFSDGGVRALSGVVQAEANAPYVQWLNRLCSTLCTQKVDGNSIAPDVAVAQPVDHGSLPADLAAEWNEWLPREALWLAMPASDAHPGSGSGGILLAGDNPFSDDASALLAEWLHAWRHAWLARFRPPAWSRARLGDSLRTWRSAERKKSWWRSRFNQIALLAVCALFCPVRLTVLAPGELVAAAPSVIRAPLDGVIGQFHVRPNETVKAQQLLFSFDEAAISSRLQVARLTLATAEAKYRQFAQLALSDNSSKAQMMVLYGEISERRTEAEFLQNQLERSRVLAPRDGVVLFDDPSDWVGRPVQTGERVMRLATPDEVEIEVWLGIGDAIPIEEQAPVRLYLAASPFSSIAGQVRYIGHDAVPRPDGSYSYRLRAKLDERSQQRIGLKGTAKIYGDWVPLSYWMLRRPLATIRQYLAL
ncbi:efflux RND transporter periplasmic adaptor subunit [Pseudomonas benzenivorans]|uniref:HlyD family efflux transporter periplasmic adaptor subunit n=1 Tax=Pseudomonas benzenivorans TaxID=556533 RepID=A0ABY5H3V1_9PSED|nr:HlyD family efflux transporter periplasmic adaptor subunit [Pseudomonas benzenivorans]UTW06975.1 HlyD family efflux transporter periplasmic adaptor subunit [Pseudomonas benzenivorans]